MHSCLPALQVLWNRNYYWNKQIHFTMHILSEQSPVSTFFPTQKHLRWIIQLILTNFRPVLYVNNLDSHYVHRKIQQNFLTPIRIAGLETLAVVLLRVQAGIIRDADCANEIPITAYQTTQFVDEPGRQVNVYKHFFVVQSNSICYFSQINYIRAL